ncbi:metal-sensitive transcriptional regulator [Desulfothermobacter acidiphilus]|uniref:metal-sensitive transcriptional regulator n=1 Tax=Desulfothermobacter acidiphilus TaxID=1938353 RepID=UPI003F8BA6BC
MDNLPDEGRLAIINRLRRIEGQVRGVCRMVEEDQDCEKILDQFKALEVAVRNCRRAVIGYYMVRCVQEKFQCSEEMVGFLKQRLSGILDTPLP